MDYISCFVTSMFSQFMGEAFDVIFAWLTCSKSLKATWLRFKILTLSSIYLKWIDIKELRHSLHRFGQDLIFGSHPSNPDKIFTQWTCSPTPVNFPFHNLDMIALFKFEIMSCLIFLGTNYIQLHFHISYSNIYDSCFPQDLPKYW